MMKWIPKPRIPAWTPDPDSRAEQMAEYRLRQEEWQIAQDIAADEARERRMDDTFDDDERRE